MKTLPGMCLTVIFPVIFTSDFCLYFSIEFFFVYIKIAGFIEKLIKTVVRCDFNEITTNMEMILISLDIFI